jgi:ribosomal protein S18 acetylase RimI-like enzyme
MSELTFRELEAADSEVAAALIRACFAEQGAPTDPPSSALGETAAIVAEKLAAGGGIGAFSGEAPVALVLLAPDDGALYLGRLAVARQWRGRGLAQRLMTLAEAEARRLGFTTTRLRVRLELPANRRLFEGCGYRETARRAHPGYALPTFAVMEKRLDPPLGAAVAAR